MKLIIFCLSLFFFESLMLAQDARRVIVSSPSVQLPAEASESGLGGRVNVEVEVDESGAVTSVKGAYGPDWVCPSITRPDVIALRETAKTLAKDVKFAPAEKASTEWIGITYPSEKTENADAGTKIASPVAGGVTVERVKPRPKTITGGVMNGRAKSLPKPPYPPEARAVRASGAVSIEVLIDENGTVFSAKPVSGHLLLLGVSRTAACLTEFTQTRLQGNAVQVNGVITYNFVP